MKIQEQFIPGDDPGKFYVKKTYDATPTLDAVGRMRSEGVQEFGESKHVGRVPGWLITEWLKEAGVRWDDVHARNEIIKAKLMNGDFSGFRNWQGRF